MTAKQYDRLSPIKRQINIAMLTGWFDIHTLDHGVAYGWHPTEHPKQTYRYEAPLPNYLYDLNAMAKVLSTMTQEQWQFGSQDLRKGFSRNGGGSDEGEVDVDVDADADADADGMVMMMI